MNEKIKLLWDKAVTLVEQEPDGDWSLDTIKDKFAELIVRECAKYLEENSGYDDANNAWHPEPEELLEHFGVEE